MRFVIRHLPAAALLMFAIAGTSGASPVIDPFRIDDGSERSGGGAQLFAAAGPFMIAMGRSARLAAVHAGATLSPSSVSWANLTPGVISVDASGHVSALAPGAWSVSATYQGCFDTVHGHVGEAGTCNSAGTDNPVSEPQPPAPPRKRLIILSQYDPDPGGGGVARNEDLAGSAQGLEEQYEGDAVIVIVLGKGGVPSFAKLDSAITANGIAAGELLSIDILGHGHKVERNVSPLPDEDPQWITQIQLDLATGQMLVPEDLEWNEAATDGTGPQVGTAGVKRELGVFLSVVGAMTLHHCHSAEPGDEDPGVASALAEALDRPVTGYVGPCETTSMTTGGRHHPPTGLTETKPEEEAPPVPGLRDPRSGLEARDRLEVELTARAVQGAGRVEIEIVSTVARRIDLTVLDVLGHAIRRMDAVPIGPGTRRILWDGRSSGGQVVPSGVYFVQVRNGNLRRSARVTVVR